MLFEIMKHCRNFFPTGIVKEGNFTIADGGIDLSFVPTGAYFRIEGSIFNDGVYKYPASGLTDETFEGAVSVLAPPNDFLELAEIIEAWVSSNGSRTGFQSESFGGYSYTRATNSEGSLADWQDVFKQRLNAWRKI